MKTHKGEGKSQDSFIHSFLAQKTTSAKQEAYPDAKTKSALFKNRRGLHGWWQEFLDTVRHQGETGRQGMTNTHAGTLLPIFKSYKVGEAECMRKKSV